MGVLVVLGCLLSLFYANKCSAHTRRSNKTRQGLRQALRRAVLAITRAVHVFVACIVVITRMCVCVLWVRFQSGVFATKCVLLEWD
jgi:hypothetical protein